MKFVMLIAAVAIGLFQTDYSHAISLKKAVQLAVQENPNGRADAANIQAVASELLESQTSFKPSVDVFGDVGVQRRESPTASTVSGGTDTLLTREAGVRASLLLFDGFERANIVYRNAARVDAASFRLLSTSETLALSSVEAYIDVVRHRELVAATQSNIRRHQEILRQIRERVAGGNAPVSDRTQIEERVFAAEAVAVEVKSALRDAEDKFKKIVGRKPFGKMRVPFVRGLPGTKKKLVWQSVSNNYNIKQAEKTVREFVYSQEAAKAGYQPRVSLDGRASTGFNRNGTEGSESDLFVGLTLSWRLYDGGLSQARDRTFAERVGEAEFRRDVAVRDVEELAARAWNAHVSGQERNTVLKRQLAANTKIVSSYREEYTLSKRSLLDVLDAERARFNNKFQQISVEASARFAGYRMLATMSKLAAHFGLSATLIAPAPDVEQRITASPSAVFDVTIPPLK
ncbi:MAG: TolC family protein [Pseudomonadota bacterium]